MSSLIKIHLFVSVFRLHVVEGNCLFFLGINFCNFQEVAIHLEQQHSHFCVQITESITGEQHADVTC